MENYELLSVVADMNKALLDALKEVGNEVKEHRTKIRDLEDKNSDLYKQLGAAHGEILRLKIRVTELEKVE